MEWKNESTYKFFHLFDDLSAQSSQTLESMSVARNIIHVGSAAEPAMFTEKLLVRGLSWH